MSPIVIILLITAVSSVHGVEVPLIVCGPNSKPATCKNPCPRTCANYNDPIIRPCILRICIRGCNCNPGYVADGKKRNECVLPKYCTP